MFRRELILVLSIFAVASGAMMLAAPRASAQAPKVAGKGPPVPPPSKVLVTPARAEGTMFSTPTRRGRDTSPYGKPGRHTAAAG